jgi:tripartite-type tricarboxylate transporter receptor subunit TctC
VTFAQWSGLFVPAGVSAEVLQRLRTAARAAAADPQVQQVIRTAGSPVEYLDAPEFQAYWDADAALMSSAVKRIGKVE